MGCAQSVEHGVMENAAGKYKIAGGSGETARKEKDMKKIIAGAKYDTDTAKKLGSYSYGARSDFHFYDEELYRTKSGRYFMHGNGGPMSHYAKACDIGGWTGGEKIVPVSRFDAQEWAEKHLEVSEYESIFGEIAEDAEKEPLNLLISPALKARLWEKAEKEKKSISSLVEVILTEAMKIEP